MSDTNTDYFSTIEGWRNDAETTSEDNPARDGDQVIWRNDGEYVIYAHRGAEYVDEGDDLRILYRAPKSRPAWHDLDIPGSRLELRLVRGAPLDAGLPACTSRPQPREARRMTGWIIYSIITTVAVLVFIGTPLAIRLNGYQGRHIRK